ncbi:MAG: ABC transporter permease, partial [Anaerolineae bacterium]|nr:ABC transporter permease [Anaerolineae bacterium]
MATASLRLKRLESPRRARGLWHDAGRRLIRHRLAMLGLAVLLVVAIMALLGPNLVSYDPNIMDFNARFSPPSFAHPLGTDDFGRDMFTRVVYGSRVSLYVGVVAVSLSATVGSLLGMVAGYGNRIIDEIIMRLMDVLYAFPAILLAIAILAALGKGVGNAMIAIGVVYIPIFARIAR